MYKPKAQGGLIYLIKDFPISFKPINNTMLSEIIVYTKDFTLEEHLRSIWIS